MRSEKYNSVPACLGAFLALIFLAGGAMGAGTTDWRLIMNLTNKTVKTTGKIAIRESVSVLVTNVGNYGASGLWLAIIYDDEIYAGCSNFTDHTTWFTGTLDMNTVEFTNHFHGMRAQAERTFDLALWDLNENTLLINDDIEVQNNPFATNMADASAAPTISGNTNYAPSAKGVTNGDSHDHSGGDGGTIAHSTLSGIGTNTHANIDSKLDALGGYTGMVARLNTDVGANSNRWSDAASLTGAVVRLNTDVGAGSNSWKDAASLTGAVVRLNTDVGARSNAWDDAADLTGVVTRLNTDVGANSNRWKDAASLTGTVLTALQPASTSACVQNPTAAWRVLYVNGSTQVTWIALGAANTFLKSVGTASAPVWGTLTASATNVYPADLVGTMTNHAMLIGNGTDLILVGRTGILDRIVLQQDGAGSLVDADFMDGLDSTAFYATPDMQAWTNRMTAWTNEMASAGGWTNSAEARLDDLVAGTNAIMSGTNAIRVAATNQATEAARALVDAHTNGALSAVHGGELDPVWTGASNAYRIVVTGQAVEASRVLVDAHTNGALSAVHGGELDPVWTGASNDFRIAITAQVQGAVAGWETDPLALQTSGTRNVMYTNIILHPTSGLGGAGVIGYDSAEGADTGIVALIGYHPDNGSFTAPFNQDRGAAILLYGANVADDEGACRIYLGTNDNAEFEIADGSGDAVLWVHGNAQYVEMSGYIDMQGGAVSNIGNAYGNAAGLTNLNASQLLSGTVDTNRLTRFRGANTNGFVSSAAGDEAKYLRGDGTWQTVAATGGGDTYLASNNIMANARPFDFAFDSTLYWTNSVFTNWTQMTTNRYYFYFSTAGRVVTNWIQLDP